MNFETTPSGKDEEREVPPAEREVRFDRRFGGPLKPNDLLTSKLGIDESKPILERLKVSYKISLLTPEIPLGGGAFAPAEYRIEVMHPNAPEKPAPEPYVRFLFDTLREARVPVSRAANAPPEDEAG
jgi:hypothetical protein